MAYQSTHSQMAKIPKWAQSFFFCIYSIRNLNMFGFAAAAAIATATAAVDVAAST